MHAAVVTLPLVERVHGVNRQVEAIKLCSLGQYHDCSFPRADEDTHVEFAQPAVMPAGEVPICNQPVAHAGNLLA